MKNFVAFVINYSSKLDAVNIVTLCSSEDKPDYKLVMNKKYGIKGGKTLLNDLNTISKGNRLKTINFKVVDDTIKSCGYAFDIFEKQKKAIPHILLAYMIDSQNKSNNLGYVIFNCKRGACFNVKTSDLIDKARLYNKHNVRLLHNAKFVEATEDRGAHISLFYANSIDTFTVSTVTRDRIAKYSIEKETADKSKYNASQLAILRAAKNNGKAYNKVCDPRLSAEQMKELLEIDDLGFDCKALASPKYDVKVLRFYKAEIRNKVDLRCYVVKSKKTGANYLAYKFTVPQLVEIRLGAISGINYRKYMNPSTPASEMTEIRTRLERKLWATEEDFTEDVKNLVSKVEMYKRRASKV